MNYSSPPGREGRSKQSNVESVYRTSGDVEPQSIRLLCDFPSQGGREARGHDLSMHRKKSLIFFLTLIQANFILHISLYYIQKSTTYSCIALYIYKCTNFLH